MRAASLILILATACATTDSKQHGLRVDVVEQRGQRMTIAGPHAYLVRVTNISAEAIGVESIHLAPSGASEFTFEDAMQSIGDELASGETREYPMMVEIVAQSRGASQFTSNIDSVSVTVSCVSPTGNFVDSEVVSVSRR